MNAKNVRTPGGGAAAGANSSLGEQYAMDMLPSKEADLSNEKCK